MYRILVALLLVGCAISHADMMIKTRTVSSDTEAAPNVQNPSEHREIRYRSGAMRREDSLGQGVKVIFSRTADCNTKTGFLIDPGAREYRSYRTVRFPTIAQLDEYRQKNPQNSVQVESKTIDTGERKTFFGQTAKHLITTTIRSADDENPGGEETIDGWYIEHEMPDTNCAPDYVRTETYYVVPTTLVDFPQIPHLHHTGPLPTGLAVKVIATRKILRKGLPSRTITVDETVEELSDSPLDPSLFEMPSGFRENPELLGGRSGSSPTGP